MPSGLQTLLLRLEALLGSDISSVDGARDLVMHVGRCLDRWINGIYSTRTKTQMDSGKMNEFIGKVHSSRAWVLLPEEVYNFKLEYSEDVVSLNSDAIDQISRDMKNLAVAVDGRSLVCFDPNRRSVPSGSAFVVQIKDSARLEKSEMLESVMWIAFTDVDKPVSAVFRRFYGDGSDMQVFVKRFYDSEDQVVLMQYIAEKVSLYDIIYRFEIKS